MFRIYDWDKDFKVNHADLCQTFKVLLREKLVCERLLDEEAVKNMASEALVRYGARGEVRLEQFVELVQKDEVKEVMTFRFSKNYEAC